MTANDDYILEILENVGLITREQAIAARNVANQEDLPVLTILDREKVLDKREALKALAGQFGMDMIVLTGMDIDREVLDMVPGEVAQRYKVVPVFRNGNTLTVAMGDPLDVDTLDGLRYVLKCNVEGVVAMPEEIEKAIANYYGRATGAVDAVISSMAEGTLAVPEEAQQQIVGDSEVSEADAPIIKLVSLIIMEAFRSRASDIHLEPMPKKFRMRYRIDGVLHEVDSPPKRLQ
ncbi:MAG: type II/IV secretion system protein, partial [Kiritimatiellae bacterium]|nr:type II/IV secretion system protein [Kiritimatiellia bacterium]